MTKGEVLKVKKRNGRLEDFDVSKINRCAERACFGIENVSASEIILDSEMNLYDKVKTKEIDKSLISSSRSKIYKEPNYAKVSARLLLNNIYKEVFKESVDSDAFELQYRKSFITNLRKLSKNDIIDKKLLNFDLKKLSNHLKIERDNLWKYIGIQSVYDRYLKRIDKVVYEAPQSFWMRVAMGLALDEKEEEREDWAIKFYDKLSNFDFMCSTPTLFNSGTTHPQMSSCYLNTFDDSIDGIFDGLWQEAKKSKFAGGLGFDVTNLRARGSFIKGTNGENQGPVYFWKLYNDMLVAVNQGGLRKGAGCAYLETWHADIEDFLEMRNPIGDDRSRGHDMNTANWIPDLFMKQKEKNESWYLFSPNEVKDLHELYGKEFEEKYWEYVEKGKNGELRVFKEVNAKELWKKMLNAIFHTGHPWITFKDPSNIRYSCQHEGVVHSSNLCTEILEHTKPTVYKDNNKREVKEYGFTANCFTKDTRILTKNGYKEIIDCDGVEVYVPFKDENNFEKNNSFEKAKLVSQGVKGVYVVKTKSGQEIKATEDHPFLVKTKIANYRRSEPNRKPTLEKYEWKKVKDLNIKDKISSPLNDSLVKSVKNNEDFSVAGWFLGDGWQSNGAYGVCFGYEEDYAREKVINKAREWWEKCPSKISYNYSFPKTYLDKNNVYCWSSSKKSFVEFMNEKFGFKNAIASTKNISNKIFNESFSNKASFLSGLFSADGCISVDTRAKIKRLTVCLTSASKELLQNVQLLLKEFGIHSRICDSFPRKKYQGSLRISSYESVERYYKYIGFSLAPKKQEKLKSNLDVKKIKNYQGLNQSEVISIEYIGEEEVYDLSLDSKHHFIANGMTVHNCNLNSINLKNHLKYNKKTRKYELDYDKIAETTQIAIRALDNVIDNNFYPTYEAENSNKRYRPVGFGSMGWQDVFHLMDIDYSSDEAVDLSDKIYEFISYHSILSSSKLSEERGKFPTYEGSSWSKGIFPIDTYCDFMKNYRDESFNKTPKDFETLDWDKVRKEVEEKGMRNSLTMAIAPTATISYISDCSQSIEPMFSNLFVYSTLSGEFLMLNENFVNDMKARFLWTSEISDLVKQTDGDLSLLDDSIIPPDLKNKYKTAFNQDQFKLIECAAARQKWIDQGQSLNLYNSGTSRKFLNDIYTHSWNTGLKTTYYLRGKAASDIEKSNVQKKAPTDAEKQACSIEAMRNGEICEACQ